MEIVDIVGIPQKRGFLKERFILLDVIINCVLRNEVRDPEFGVGVAGCVGEGRPDVVFQGWSIRGGSGEVDALSFFNLHGFLRSIFGKGLKEIRDGVNH